LEVEVKPDDSKQQELYLENLLAKSSLFLFSKLCLTRFCSKSIVRSQQIPHSAWNIHHLACEECRGDCNNLCILLSERPKQEEQLQQVARQDLHAATCFIPSRATATEELAGNGTCKVACSETFCTLCLLCNSICTTWRVGSVLCPDPVGPGLGCEDMLHAHEGLTYHIMRFVQEGIDGMPPSHP